MPFFSIAQSSYEKDSLFFQQQVEKYQDWLNKTGIGDLVYDGQLEIKSQKIILNLVARPDKKDSFWPYWQQWQRDYIQKNPIRLEQKLFYKLHHMLEVEQDHLELRVFDQRVRFCHRLIIAFVNGEVITSKQSCRAKERQIEVSPSVFYEENGITYEEIQNRYPRSIIFNKILEYSKEKYGTSECERRYPKITLLEQGDVLRFVVTDLCKEVLVDESDPWICKVLRRLGHQCNWIKREKLEFLISYQKTTEGIKIGVHIDGKYGSGYYENVKRGGYHLMDNDFDDYLEDYADRMKNEFKTLILEIQR